MMPHASLTMNTPPHPRGRSPGARFVRVVAMAAVAIIGLGGKVVAQSSLPAGCERVPAFYEAHAVTRDFFPCGFYGGPGAHPLLGMPPALAAEVSLERFAAYGINVVLSPVDFVERQGRPVTLGELGQLLYGTLLPRYEIKVMPSVATKGFRFNADAFAAMQRNTPLLSASEMASAERKLADKLSLLGDVARRYPETILGFISDDEPHLMAPAVASARLIEKHTGSLATFPMPTFDTAAAFSEHMQPMMADWYVCGDLSRDNWCIAARMRTIARQWPGRIFWFVPLAISFTGGHEATLPNLQDSRTTRAELRLQCWSAIATGAKGVFFYNPGGWAFTWGGNEDPLFDTMGRPNATHPRQDNLAEIRSLAADFTAIGPSLLTACPIVEPALRIDCEGVRYATFSGPALDCGMLSDAANRRDFLVPWNNDIDRARRGVLHLPENLLAGGRMLYDLHDLRQVELGTERTLQLSLPPGTGRVYMLGDAESFRAVRESILRHRVRPERVRARSLSHRLRIKAGSKPPAEWFAATDAGIAGAEAAEARGDWQAAAAAYRDVIADLERRAVDLPTAAAEAALDRAGGIIAAADELMRTHDVRLYDLVPMTDTVRLSDTKLPVQAEQQALIALVKRYLDLEYKLFAGRSGADAAAADALARDATAYRTALWRKFSERLAERRKPFRIALITPDREGIEETMAYAWAYGRCEACWIAPDGRGTLVDTDGRTFDPGDYDAVWVHQLRYHAQPTAGTTVDPAQVLMPALMDPTVRESLRTYVADGGGLLLTGVAGLYVVPLGVEGVLPDRIRENDYLTRDLSVGIIPAPGAERHPALAHVPAAGHLTNGGPRGQPVATECVWEKRRPTGTVLAQELDGQYGRLADVATVVEYELGAGKVLVLGGLGCDLTPGSVAGGDARSRARQTTLDALEYLAGDQRYALQDAATTATTAAAAARPLGKRDARPEVGPNWMQNARARVEMTVGEKGTTAGFRYLRWDANTGKWVPFLQQAFLGSDIRDGAEMDRVRKRYGVYSTFDRVLPTRVVPAVQDGSASLRFRLEQPDIWAEYRLSLIKDSPFLLVEQADRSRADLFGMAVVTLDRPMEFGVAGATDAPGEFAEHLARDQREQGWLLRITRVFAAATPDDSRISAIFPASVSPKPQVILMTPGIKQMSQVALPFFYVGHVGPAAANATALEEWVNEQFTPLEPFRVPQPKQ